MTTLVADELPMSPSDVLKGHVADLEKAKQELQREAAQLARWRQMEMLSTAVLVLRGAGSIALIVIAIELFRLVG
jgi:hypothetical protein